MNEEELTALNKKVFEAYMQKTPKSKQFHDRACRSLSGGVSGSLKLFQPYPLHMTHGRGSKIYDVDANEYIDCQAGQGCLLLGHCYPEVVESIKHEMDKGLLVFNLDLIVECAELLKEIVPCAESVRFANSGTEADIAAVRIARSFTGKSKIIKFYGHYHGQDDQFVIATASNKPVVGSTGIPKESLANTILLRYNDIDAVRRRLDEDNDIAGVILDPQMSRGVWPPSREYLKQLRELTKERGVVLIFDEVMTGFRLALGGAQEYFGVTPDLAVFAKSIASGAKLAAIVGKEGLMSLTTPKGIGITGGGEGTCFQSGTYNDGTIAIAAAIATLKIYKKLNEKGEYEKLHQRTRRLKSAIETAFMQRGIGCHVNSIGNLCSMYLTDLEPNYDAYCNLDNRLRYLFFLSLIPEGVFLTIPSSGFIFLSFVHTEEDLQSIIGAINSSLDKYKFEAALSELKAK